jgi:stage II sporulation protein AA (anti-sigma F factor antagonist)
LWWKKGVYGLVIETERIGPNLIVEIDGELDLKTSPAFREVVDDKLNHYESIKHLILDLGKVSFIDSSGLGVILGRFKRLNQQGGKISAVNVSAQIHRILQLSGLLKIMDIYDDRHGALKNSWR